MKKPILLILILALCSTTEVFAVKLQASSISIQDLHNSTLADIYLRSHGKLIDNMASDSLQRNDSNVDTTMNNSTQDQSSNASDSRIQETVASEAPVMPNIPLLTLDGTEVTFEDVRQGKPVVINYFASWCPPCKQELPYFQKAYDTYKDQISFIFLDSLDGQRETLETVKAFIRDFPFTGPVYYDEGIFAYIFQTTSLPTTVFINADGTLANGYLGSVSESVLIENLETLLSL